MTREQMIEKMAESIYNCQDWHIMKSYATACYAILESHIGSLALEKLLSGEAWVVGKKYEDGNLVGTEILSTPPKGE